MFGGGPVGQGNRALQEDRRDDLGPGGIEGGEEQVAGTGVVPPLPPEDHHVPGAVRGQGVILAVIDEARGMRNSTVWWVPVARLSQRTLLRFGDEETLLS